MEDQDEEMDQIPEEGSNSIAMKILKILIYILHIVVLKVYFIFLAEKLKVN